ncbi:MAG: hypothetical protein FJ161_02975 [Gammaproteobacteria bacterium]|nr:hypothetical protein [Gammaproteobacteria bacterium]
MKISASILPFPSPSYRVRIAERIFFCIISLICLSLAKWQLNRANALNSTVEHLQRDSLVPTPLETRIFQISPSSSKKEFILLQNRDDRQYYFCALDDYDQNEIVLFDKAPIVYSVIDWIVPPFSLTNEDGYQSSSLYELAKMQCTVMGVEDIGLLKQSINSNWRSDKRYRHYGYAVQWVIFAMISGYFFMKTEQK